MTETGGWKISRMALRILHGLWLVWIAVWGFWMVEVRATVLGAALLVSGLATLAVIVTDEWLAWRKRKGGGVGIASRRPWFTVQVAAGVVAIACGVFGILECFYLDLPGDTMVMVVNGKGPLSRWVFMVGGIYGVTVLYGAVVVALGSGLVGARPVAMPRK